MTLWN